MPTTHSLRFIPLRGISRREIISIFALSFVLLFAMAILPVNAQEVEEDRPSPGGDRVTDEEPGEGGGDEDEDGGIPTPIGDIRIPAQTEAATADSRAEQLVALDENITAADLGVAEQSTGSFTNPFRRAFRGLTRTVQTVTTRDPIQRVELKERFANEDLVIAKALQESEANDGTVKRAVEKYEREVERAKTELNKLKTVPDKAKVEAVVKRTAASQIRHHKILGAIMKKRENIAPEIEEAKTAAMRHFSQGMAAIVEPEVLQQKVSEAIMEQKGSSFRHFKHVEMLEEMKDFVPERARGAIQNAIEQSSKAFEEEFRQIDEQERKVFNKYIEKIGGNEVRHLEAFDSIGAFTNIEKGMFEEMEKAREKARRRVEHRMKQIKDETRKKVFIAHLEEGKMEDARIVRELETNLDPSTITAVLDIKRKMEQKMRERFEQAESTGDLDNFFGEMEKFRDVQMLQTLSEMEGIIPPDKKDFWQEMKKKAMNEMQEELNKARQLGRLGDKMRMMAGSEPEHMSILDEFEGEFGPQVDFFQDMRREQADRIQDRFKHLREFADEKEGLPESSESEEFLEKAERFKRKIEENPNTREDMRRFAPAMERRMQDFEAQQKERRPRALQAPVPETKLPGERTPADEVFPKVERRVREQFDLKSPASKPLFMPFGLEPLKDVGDGEADGAIEFGKKQRPAKPAPVRPTTTRPELVPNITPPIPPSPTPTISLPPMPTPSFSPPSMP